MTVSDLVEVVLEDRDFMQGTGGGVTFSGGEPLLQGSLLFECADRLRNEGIHVAVETSGLWPAKLETQIREKIDLVIFDLKHVDLKKLRRVMGVKCDRILQNLTALYEHAVPIELRLTLVPGFNADEEDLTAIAEWLKSVEAPQGRQNAAPGASPGSVEGKNESPGGATEGACPELWLLPFQRLAAAKESIYGTAYPFRDIEPMSDTALARAAETLARLGVDAKYE